MQKSLFVKKIRTYEELKLAMEVLVKGFGWSKNHANLIINTLITNKNNIDFYGFTLNESNDKLIGVILTLYQGYLENSGHKTLVINLSSWYVLKKHRGYKSIFMLKEVTKELSDHIITNFSPNNSAKAILKALGYKKMKTCTKNFYFYRFFPFILKELFFSSVFLLKNQNSMYFNKKFINYRDSTFIELNVKGKIIQLLINDSNVFKKIRFISFLNFKIPRFNILWCSDNDYLEKNFIAIFSFLFLRYRAFIISTHCLYLSSMSFKKYWRMHFYKPTKHSNKKPFVAGSEYSIKF